MELNFTGLETDLRNVDIFLSTGATLQFQVLKPVADSLRNGLISDRQQLIQIENLKTEEDWIIDLSQIVAIKIHFAPTGKTALVEVVDRYYKEKE